MALWSAAELQAGLVAGGAGALAIGVVLVLRARWGRAPSPSEPWPHGGLVAMVAGLAVVWILGPLPWELAAGVIGVAAAVDLLEVAGRPRWWQAVAALPFAAIVATSEALPDVRWFELLVVIAIAGGAVLAADTDQRWRREAAAPVLLAIAAGGVYAAVPDTEHALALFGVLLCFAALALPWPIVRLGTGGAAGCATLLVWVAAYGARGRPAALIGATACWGLLAAVPIGAHLGRRLPGVLDDVGARGRVVALGAVQVVIVLLAARTAGLQSSTAMALLLSMPPIAIAIGGASVLRAPEEPAPPPPARPARAVGRPPEPAATGTPSGIRPAGRASGAARRPGRGPAPAPRRQRPSPLDVPASWPPPRDERADEGPGAVASSDPEQEGP